MNDREQTTSPENSPSVDKLPTEKEPWQSPTLESLDMADSEVMIGMGGDGGVASSLS